MTITLTLYQVDYLSPYHLGLFQRFCPVRSFGTFSYFLILLDSLFVSLYEAKQLPLPVLKERTCEGDEPYH